MEHCEGKGASPGENPYFFLFEGIWQPFLHLLVAQLKALSIEIDWMHSAQRLTRAGVPRSQFLTD